MGGQLTASYDDYNAINQLVGDLNTNVKSLRKLTTEAVHAMMDVGVPTKQKTDKDIPSYHEVAPYSKQHIIPWNDDEKRAFTPAEGIQWLATQLKDGKTITKQIKKEQDLMNKQ